MAYERGGTGVQVQILEQEPAIFMAQELSDVIRTLADARMALLPPVEISDPIAGQTVQIGLASRWYVEPRPNGSHLLMLLHPGLGWISIELGQGDARRLSSLLMETSQQGPIPKAN